MQDPGRDFMFQMATHYTDRVLQEGEKGLARSLPFVTELRRYFRVDVKYVRGKLLMLAFPFNKRFARQQFLFGDDAAASSGGGGHMSSFQAGGGGGGMMGSPSASEASPAGGTASTLPPVDDVCAFDLYIPLMAVVTYVTLAGFVRGLNNQRLTAEFLTTTFSSIVFWLAVEVALVKAVRYTLGLPLVFSVLDIVALCGYKHVSTCALVLLRETLQLQGPLLLLVVAYAIAALVFFAYKTMGELYAREGRVPRSAQLLAYGTAGLQVPMLVWFATKPF